MDNLAQPEFPDTPGPASDPKPHDRRAQTSPENGAKSKGPKTESGKKKSAANSLKHGLYSRDIVLATEKPSEYDALKSEFLQANWDFWKPEYISLE